MSFAAIDLSLNCPCICLFNEKSTEFLKHSFYFFSETFPPQPKLKYIKSKRIIEPIEYPIIDFYDSRDNFPFKIYNYIGIPNIHGSVRPEYKDFQHRYDMNQRWAMDILTRFKVSNVFLEDYSFGSKGKVFQLAENCGILKHYIWKEGIQLRLVSPTEIKKHAVGSGRANKEELEYHFEKNYKIGLRQKLHLSPKKENPISDIIDSYYLAEYASKNLC